MSWWESAYRGGPMVDVEGFPRPLYPPDAAAHGKVPSVDGPDVVAYKRVVWRAGRWPGPADAFDDSYSNGFAHGRSGNVGETGVAGVQRQGAPKIDATGWVGEKTFNLLRSIRVPEGPHAGEMAMDAYAVELLNAAWEMFRGHEPAPPAKASLRARALARAVEDLGYNEGTGNRTKYGAWYGMDGQPWCAMFTTWAYVLEGESFSFEQGNRYAYVPYVVGDARAGRYGLSTTDDPIPGDLVAYDWQLDGEHDHIGLFEKWASGTSVFYAIEGNTSTSSNSNGGQVMRRSRDRSGVVFIRVNEV